MRAPPPRESIDNLLVRIHFIIVMIRWTGLAPWEFESKAIEWHLKAKAAFHLAGDHFNVQVNLRTTTSQICESVPRRARI